VNAKTDVDQTWDPLEVVNCWWWSGSACRFRITFSFSSPLQLYRGFLDIC